MMDIATATAKVISAIGYYDKKATVYLSPTLVVSVCHRIKPTSRSTRREYVLKIGRPNVRQGTFIKACKKAGEPFPVKKVQLQPWPVKRKKRA